MAALPQDPFILYSYVNTQLRDHYASLDEFCRDADISEEELVKRLEEAGFSYDAERKRFV